MLQTNRNFSELTGRITRTMKPTLSIVLPVYNESQILERNVLLLESRLEEVTKEFEIIIVEDGSTDGSDVIARRLSLREPRIIHLHSETRLGKGRALKNALMSCEGDYTLFMDVDLETDLKHIAQFLALLMKGHAAVVGSRLKRGTRVTRPISRQLSSCAYNLLVNLVLGDRISDHQCGFKAFRRSALDAILNDVNDSGFFFDTEIIVRLLRAGFSVLDVPVHWTERRISVVHESPMRLVVKMLALRRQLRSAAVKV